MGDGALRAYPSLAHLQFDWLQVVRNPQRPGEVRLALGSVELLASGDIAILGVVEQEVSHTELPDFEPHLVAGEVGLEVW